MIRKYIYILVIFLFSIPLFSAEFDWGGTIQNVTGGSGKSEWTFNQSDSVSLWFEINGSSMFNIKASGGYRFNYDDEEISHIPEFGAFYAHGSNGTISYRLGRFSTEDMNGNLFSTILDGGRFSLQTSKVKIRAGAGFSGYVFNENSSVAMTSADFTAISDDALLAPPRLAEYAEAALYILPGDGALTASFLAQQDLRDGNELDEGQGLLNSFYLSIGLKGRLGRSIFYNLYGTGELGFYNMTVDDRSLILGAGAGGLKLDIPFNAVLNPYLSMDFYYSSGDSWDRTDHRGSLMEENKTVISQYTPFSMENKGYVFSVGTGNLFYGDIAFSVTPFRGFSVQLASLTLFRSVDGPVAALSVSEDDSASSLYLGEELTLAMNFRPLSDVGFQIKGGVFLPNEEVVLDTVQYKIGGYLSLGF